jgi:S-(hydroxymethyl)glutathione dehydrogenase / alcohol dehydrogenase
MRIEAAVFNGVGTPLEHTELELAEPRHDEVLVRLLASGICHSDLSFIDGSWPAPLPIVLGHEGFGVVDAVGPGVQSPTVGEHVVLTFSPACGRCRFCLAGRSNLCVVADRCMNDGCMWDGTTRLARGDQAVHHLALVASFASHTVVPAAGAIPVDSRLDPAVGCLLGCGVTTGILSVTRRAQVRPGESVAVFACGGVGLSAIIGAALVSAHPVIAVDPLANKRAMALELGATHAIDPGVGNPAEQIREIVSGGVDHAFEAIGRPEVALAAFESVRTGGTTTLIGQPALGVTAAFPVYDVTQFEHTILGSNLGAAVPALHIPQLANLVVAGKLDLSPLITDRYALGEIEEAVARTASGHAGRVVIDLANANGHG